MEPNHPFFHLASSDKITIPHSPHMTTQPLSSSASCTDFTHLLRQRLFIARQHLVTNTTMAQKDENGLFTWVEFNPIFHSQLIKRAFSLMGMPTPTPMRKLLKKAIFEFALELLNQETKNTTHIFFNPDTLNNSTSSKLRPAPTPSSHPPSDNNKGSLSDTRNTIKSKSTPMDNPPQAAPMSRSYAERARGLIPAVSDSLRTVPGLRTRLHKACRPWALFHLVSYHIYC